MRKTLLSLLLLAATAGLAQDQRFSEEIVVRVIDVDVVVTDKNGNRITGLTREDFELFEDGKPVEIKYFSGVAGGRLADMPPSPAAAPAAPGAPAAPAATQPAPASAPVTWVVFFDQTNMHPGRRNRTVRHLRTFLETNMAAADHAIIASNDGMAMRIRQTMTKDRKVLLDALTKLEKERVHQGPAMSRMSQIRYDIREAANADEGVERDMDIKGVGMQIAMVIDEEAQRMRNAIRSMSALVDVLAGVEGRLALVYVGAGFNTVPAQELVESYRNTFPQMRTDAHAPDPEQHKQYLNEEVNRLYANLSATRVTVYTVHAGGVAGAGGDDVGSLSTGGEVPGDWARAAEAGLAREMAQRTGGLYFTVNPGLVKQLASVRADLDDYYSLGYVPTGPPGDSRRVKVRVKREGARVRHRETVRERTRPEEASRTMIAAAVQPRTMTSVKRVEQPASAAVTPTEANPLGVQVEAARPGRDAWGKDHLLPFNLQLGSLQFHPRGGVYRAEFVLHFALIEPNGTIWPIESRQHALEIPNAEVPASPDQYASFSWHVDLSPLRVPPEIPIKMDGIQLHVTVEDRASNVRSVVTVPVQKPGPPIFPGGDKKSGS